MTLPGRKPKVMLDVLGYIKDVLTNTGKAPTHVEITRHFGFKSPNSARAHIKALIKRGYVEHTPNKARGIKVIDEQP